MKRKIIFSLLALIVAIQFIRPAKNSSASVSPNDIRTKYTMPAEVENILKTSCFDCHSNNTVYPWYNNIQPVGWWLQYHVNDAKEELNFSEFATYSPKRMNHKYKEIIEQIKEDEMPLFSYTIMHTNAKLSQQQKDILVAWFEKQKRELNYIDEPKRIE